ncbi:NADH-ubiquinone oxidoreductase B15 subunit [Oesophagostomum dentatum]|uniref:NADH dehydrogenase [ubiquinone] 1 beta subcomplex subunit 4 n=1 Tax=Oesophagostomum dentatum TaxID=61180 RepID=A0A0B1T7U8_OESDE|nr:NADH-ubiquinone oxidoreductase B15 subunit [Oesophagostomum dentatum]
MWLALRLLRPAAKQKIKNPKLWQDPVIGYFETHGKMEFLPGQEYNLTDDEKKAVLWRYRVKEILKKEYLRREYDPHNFKYKEGVVMDPAMFRWYSADMTQAEFFRVTPRSIFLYVGTVLLIFYLYTRLVFIPIDKSNEACLDGELLWWDRQQGRTISTAAGWSMAELKAALKQAKKLLSEGHSEEALEALQEALDDETEDYMLFSFAALAHANMGDAKQARILYEKVDCRRLFFFFASIFYISSQAIKLDAKLPAAWQGLYKLFDTGKLPPDDRALEVCNHLIASSDSDEKRHAIEETRRRFYFELNRYEQLEVTVGLTLFWLQNFHSSCIQKDPGNDPIFLGKIADKLAKKDVMSVTETALVRELRRSDAFFFYKF